MLAGCIWRFWVVLLLFAVPSWWGTEAEMVGIAGISLNKPFCGSTDLEALADAGALGIAASQVFFNHRGGGGGDEGRGGAWWCSARWDQCAARSSGVHWQGTHVGDVCLAPASFGRLATLLDLVQMVGGSLAPAGIRSERLPQVVCPRRQLPWSGGRALQSAAVEKALKDLIAFLVFYLRSFV